MLATREELKHKISPGYSFARHVVLIHIVVLAFVGAALAELRDLEPVELLAIPATFLFANVVEYVAHRYPMHHRMGPLAILFERHTVGHHAYFRAESMRVEGTHEMRFVLFPAWAAAVVLLISSPLGIGVALLASRNAGLLYVVTAAGYYLLYEWFHASYHLAGPERLARIPVLGAAAGRHARHHDPTHMTESDFNITFPIVDAIVGTMSARAPAAARAQPGA
jgi:hypothetical protein